jgi:phage tail tape-measure protein
MARSGLVAKKMADKRGHTVTRWVSPNKNGAAAHHKLADESHPAPGAKSGFTMATPGKENALVKAGGAVVGAGKAVVGGAVGAARSVGRGVNWTARTVTTSFVGAGGAYVGGKIGQKVGAAAGTMLGPVGSRVGGFVGKHVGSALGAGVASHTVDWGLARMGWKDPFAVHPADAAIHRMGLKDPRAAQKASAVTPFDTRPPHPVPFHRTHNGRR